MTDEALPTLTEPEWEDLKMLALSDRWELRADECTDPDERDVWRANAVALRRIVSIRRRRHVEYPEG